MSGDFLNLLILSSVFLVLFAIGECLHRFLNVKGEYTRKLIHAGTGVLTLLFPVMLHSHWSVLLICSSFLVILLARLEMEYSSFHQCNRPVFLGKFTISG